MKQISTRVDKKAIVQLQKLYGNNSAGTSRAAECFPYIRRAVIAEIKGTFQINELHAIIDSFNGTIIDPQYSANKQMLIAHLEDANQYEYIGKRFNIDIQDLLKKVQELTTAQAFFLQEEIYRFWNVEEAYGNPNPNLKKFVEDLT